MRPINIFFGLCAISVVFFVIFLLIRNHQSREIELLTSPSNYIGVFAVTTSGEIAGASTASLILKDKIIALFLMLAGAGKRLSAAVIFIDIDDITLGNPTEYVYTDLDLNSDGLADLTFQTGRSDLVCFSTVGGGVAGIPTVPPNQNHFAAAFSYGAILGVSLPTESLYRWNEGYSGMLSCRDAGCLGLWEDKTAYLGVQFSTATGIHYGWVEVFVFGNTSTGSILSFAYESEPSRPIVAGQIPEPSGVLLMAATWLSGLCRRRRKSI